MWPDRQLSHPIMWSQQDCPGAQSTVKSGIGGIAQHDLPFAVTPTAVVFVQGFVVLGLATAT